MFKFRYTLIAILGLFVAVAFTQESTPAKPEDASAGEVKPVAIAAAESEVTPAPKPPTARKRRPIPVATPTAVATPKPGFWQRVFGPKKPKSTPAPSTPTAVVKTKSGGPAPAPAKKKIASANVAEEETPKSSGEGEKPKPPVVAKNTAKSKPENPQATPPPGEGKDPETQLRERYDAAKAKAAEDPEVKKMKERADAAPTEEEARKALRDYNKALFERMREIDPSIKDRVDRMETAVLNRLGL